MAISTSGTILKLFYTQSSFPAGMCVPYQASISSWIRCRLPCLAHAIAMCQCSLCHASVPSQVELFDGRKIYAPMDEDRVVRAPLSDTSAEVADEEDTLELPEAEKMPVMCRSSNCVSATMCFASWSLESSGNGRPAHQDLMLERVCVFGSARVFVTVRELTSPFFCLFEWPAAYGCLCRARSDPVPRARGYATHEHTALTLPLIFCSCPAQVTVVTGFLGAGKTTLVNYILREQHGKRICGACCHQCPCGS